MASAFDKQQTIETIRANIELRQSIWDKNTTTYEEWKARDKAEKARKYKIRIINEWRAKQK